MTKTRWGVEFSSGCTIPLHIVDFPHYTIWHSDKDSAIAEGRRVWRELKALGETREWTVKVYRHPVDSHDAGLPCDLHTLTPHDLEPPDLG